MRDEGEMCLDTLLTTKDNRSVAISFAGYNIGVALTFSGCISSSMYDYPPEYPVEDQLKSLVPTLVFQVLALFFMVMAHGVNDKDLMYNIRNIDATKHKTASTAIGIVEAASFIGSGYIIGSGTYTWVDLDDGEGWGHGLVMFPVFFIVGQTARSPQSSSAIWWEEETPKPKCATATVQRRSTWDLGFWQLQSCLAT